MMANDYWTTATRATKRRQTYFNDFFLSKGNEYRQKVDHHQSQSFPIQHTYRLSKQKISPREIYSHFIGVLVDQRNIVIIKCSSILLLEALTTIFLNLKWMGGLKFVILSRVVGTSTKWYANMLTRVKLLYFFAFIEISEFFFSLKFWKKKCSQVKGGVSANDWKFWWVWNF